MKNAENETVTEVLRVQDVVKVSTRTNFEKEAEILYAANVTMQEAVEKFTELYKVHKSIENAKFVAKRTKIYLGIAAKRAATAAAVAAKK